MNRNWRLNISSNANATHPRTFRSNNLFSSNIPEISCNLAGGNPKTTVTSGWLASSGCRRRQTQPNANPRPTADKKKSKGFVKRDRVRKAGDLWKAGKARRGHVRYRIPWSIHPHKQVCGPKSEWWRLLLVELITLAFVIFPVLWSLYNWKIASGDTARTRRRGSVHCDPRSLTSKKSATCECGHAPRHHPHWSVVDTSGFLCFLLMEVKEKEKELLPTKRNRKFWFRPGNNCYRFSSMSIGIWNNTWTRATMWCRCATCVCFCINCSVALPTVINGECFIEIWSPRTFWSPPRGSWNSRILG